MVSCSRWPPACLGGGHIDIAWFPDDGRRFDRFAAVMVFANIAHVEMVRQRLVVGFGSIIVFGAHKQFAHVFNIGDHTIDVSRQSDERHAVGDAQ